MFDDSAAAPSSSPEAPMSGGSMQSPFTLTAGPFAAGHLRVVSFHGEEAASQPFSFDLAVTVGSADASDL